MRRKILPFLIGTASLLPFALSANDIEPTKEFYTATRAATNTPIVIDGVLDEWTGVPVLADPKFYIRNGFEGTPQGKGSGGVNATLVLFERYQGGDWTGPDDQTSAVQIVYDADNVYFGFTVTDEYHENAANSAWNGDSVQLMIANSNRTAQVALYNYALGGTEDALGSTIVMHEAGPGGTTAVVTRDTVAKKTYYEIQLPASSLGLTSASLKPGTKFGLGMAINDGDQLTPGQKGWGGLGAHSIVFGKTPSETALVTLGTNYPGTNNFIFFSAINPTIDLFTFRANDAGTAIVDPASAKLTIDGHLVPLTFLRSGSAVDFTNTPAIPFAPSIDHTYLIEVKDTLGNRVTSDGTFRTPPYALLAAADKVMNPTEPGFLWRIHQNDRFTSPGINRILQQLAGLLGENFADPDARGPTFIPGVPGPTVNDPITFEIEDVVNLDEAAGSSGAITPDAQMPGLPGRGASGQTDGIAAEIITYLQLPVGRHTLVVNSEDGFRTMAGNINDIFRAQVAGEFDQTRTPAADTAYDVRVLDAGVYAFRTVFGAGAAGASIEWKLRKEDGTDVLLNDLANDGFPAYRRATGLPTGVNVVSPLPGSTGVALDSPIFASIVQGSSVVDSNSIRLSLDGAIVSSQPTRLSSNAFSIKYQPPAFLSSAQHTASIAYSAGGNSQTQSWTFTVETYVTLTKAHKAVSVDRTKPGFIWRVFQNETYTHTTLAETELALAGQLIAPGQVDPLPNLADPAAVGAASGPGTPDGPLLKFEVPTVINLSQIGGTAFGNFGSDEQMPGIPGSNASNDGIDAEIVTFADLPAGVITMGVNSDDGFRTQAGYINKPEDGVVLGEFDGGRAATDTTFKIVVQEAGVYPLRTIWQEGGGDANIEWFIIKADGTKVLLNDTINDGPVTYRIGVAPSASLGAVSVHIVGGQVEITWTEPGAVLQDSTNLTGWTDLPAATSPYHPTVAGRPIVFYRLKK